MTDEVSTSRMQEVCDCLRLLTQDEGVQRKELLRFLRKDTPELARIWHIDPINGDDAARKTAAGSLHAIISQTRPRPARQQLTPEEGAKQYRHAVAVCFNLFQDPEISGKNLKLQQRREWLASKGRGKNRIAVSVGQEDLKHAIEQIAQHLTTPGYVPTIPDGRDISNEVPSPPGQPVKSSFTLRKSRRITIAVASIVASLTGARRTGDPMPGGGVEGPQAVRKISELDIPVLVISMRDEPAPVLDSISAGAKGYLTKEAEPAEIVRAIAKVANGQTYFSATVAGYLLKTNSQLTAREREVLKFVASGETTKSISRILNIAETTVNNHLDRIRNKTGSRNRTDLTRLAIARGLVDPSE